jgi:hypothetical protein
MPENSTFNMSTFGGSLRYNLDGQDIAFCEHFDVFHVWIPLYVIGMLDRVTLGPSVLMDMSAVVIYNASLFVQDGF